ncbi:MAG TPA: GxxExxY protein [Gemmatimonadaceae bacterium]|nr:GxxExxY protein [Gemmatimonadaceae bacterium]
MKIDTITSEIIRAAMVVHSALGPGLLESVYQACLTHLLRQNGLSVDTERPVPVLFNGLRFELGFRLDLLVEEQVVVEVKAIRRIQPVHSAQLLSYMKLSDKKVGLLLNFHVRHMRHGIQRLVNGLDES